MFLYSIILHFPLVNSTMYKSSAIYDIWIFIFIGLAESIDKEYLYKTGFISTNLQFLISFATDWKLFIISSGDKSEVN